MGFLGGLTETQPSTTTETQKLQNRLGLGLGGEARTLAEQQAAEAGGFQAPTAQTGINPFTAGAAGGAFGFNPFLGLGGAGLAQALGFDPSGAAGLSLGLGLPTAIGGTQGIQQLLQGGVTPTQVLEDPTLRSQFTRGADIFGEAFRRGSAKSAFEASRAGRLGGVGQQEAERLGLRELGASQSQLLRDLATQESQRRTQAIQAGAGLAAPFISGIPAQLAALEAQKAQFGLGAAQAGAGLFGAQISPQIQLAQLEQQRRLTEPNVVASLAALPFDVRSAALRDVVGAGTATGTRNIQGTTTTPQTSLSTAGNLFNLAVPAIGTALGGPLGGAIGSSLFGLSNPTA